MRSVVAWSLALLAVALGAAAGFGAFRSRAAASETASGRGEEAPPVVVHRVAPAPLGEAIEALGTVRAAESVEITSPRSKHVTAVHFDDAQVVEAGALLVELHAHEERAMLAEAEAVLEERRSRHERVSELAEREIAPQSDVDLAKAELDAAAARVETLRAVIADHEVRAPFAGRLGLRRVSVGAFLRPTDVITTLDDLATVKVDFTVPEKWLPAVRTGMRMRARSDAFPGREFPGEITAIDTRLDPRTRSATVRALVPNPDLALQPGMLLKLRLESGEDDVLQVPEEALIPIGRQHYVLRVDDASVAHRVEVRIGRRRVGAVEVESGLEHGDRVVVEGIVRVRDGAPVVVVTERGTDSFAGSSK